MYLDRFIMFCLKRYNIRLSQKVLKNLFLLFFAVLYGSQLQKVPSQQIFYSLFVFYMKNFNMFIGTEDLFVAISTRVQFRSSVGSDYSIFSLFLSFSFSFFLSLFCRQNFSKLIEQIFLKLSGRLDNDNTSRGFSYYYFLFYIE